MQKQIKPFPLTWQTAMHTGKGLQAVLEFLGETGVGTRTWISGPQTAEVGGFGWSHFGDDGSGGERTERGEGAGGEVDAAEVAGVG